MKHKKIDNFKLNPIVVISFLITIFVVSVSIGFSALSSNISIGDISALIRVKKDIRVTDFTLNTVYGSATSEDEDFNVDYIKSNITLPNQSSSVIYDVMITNIENPEMGILEITGLPSNLKYTTIGYNMLDKLCDINNSSQCNLGSVSKIQIKIEYDTNGYNASSVDYNLGLSLNFKQAFDITYIGFNSTDDLPNVILEQETKNIVFNSTHGIPNAVTVTGAIGSLNTINNTLTLTSASSNVTITNSTNSGPDGTLNNPFENTNTVYSPSSTLDEGYTVFVSATGKPRVLVENGKIVSFEYTDTGEGILFDSENDSTDTGIVAFDGGGFEINMVYTINTNNNSGNFIVSAISMPSKNKYQGFMYRCYSTSRFYLNSTAQGSSNNINNMPRITDGFRVNAGEETYTFYMKYDPTTSGGPTVTISQTPVSSGNSTYTIQTSNIPTSLDNVTISISGNGATEPVTKFAKMTVHSFSVTKF